MKNSIKIMAAFVLAVLVCGLNGCKDAEYGPLGTHAYISQSALNKNTKVTITDQGGVAEITACLSEVVAHDVTLKFEIDPSVLDRYNEKQATSYIPLPESVLQMEREVIIKAGEYSAPPTKVRILPLTQEMIGESYAIPLRLVCDDAAVPTTSVTATYVVTSDQVTTSSYPMFNGGAGIGNPEKFPLNLPEFTIEVRFQVSNTAKRNRAVFSGGPVLLRFEDPQNDNADHKAHSLVQFQGEGWYLNPSLSFKPNIWQHLALTYNGTAVTLYINGSFAGSKEGKNRADFDSCGWFGGGNSGGHGAGDEWWAGCKILCAEARIWSVCRTEAQIQNNIVSVSPKSKGLEAYWRFNEGTGQTLNDCTGNGHTMTAASPITWVPGIKSTDEKTPWPN